MRERERFEDNLREDFGNAFVEKMIETIGFGEPLYAKSAAFPDRSYCTWCGSFIEIESLHSNWHRDLTLAVHMLAAGKMNRVE